MRKAARVLIATLLFFTGAHAVAQETSPQEAWKASIAEGEEAYAGRRLATLKIDDAIYLKKGERAYLTCAAHCAWRLSPPAVPSPSVAFDGKTGMWSWNGTTVDLVGLKGGVAYSATIDVIGGIAQVAPGEEGLRVAVYNQDNPRAKQFTGFRYYPYNPDFVITAAFEALAVPKAEDFQTSRGWWKRFYLVGHALFSHEGKRVRLPLYGFSEDPAEVKEVSAFFIDDTTGKETYQTGRYIDMPLALADGPKTVTLDFNYAYNPACARSAHFNCPVATARLPFSVAAGELIPAEGEGAGH
ncbi:MAG: DUF1684 domain-containing protein [Alphaproteobacteria bacterium]|nr:DUF1684 domain-containing protein [Alphaproteobacteria bacterium]